MKNHEALQEEVVRAARYAGEAAAMTVNLAAIQSDKIEIWIAEEKVWQEREKAALAAIPFRAHRRAASLLVAETAQTSVTNNLVTVPVASQAA